MTQMAMATKNKRQDANCSNVKGPNAHVGGVAGTGGSPSTLRTSNSLSFSLARDSFLYRVSNSPLLRAKTHSGKQINEQSYSS